MMFASHERDIRLSDTGIQLIYFYDSSTIFHRTAINCMNILENQNNTKCLAIDLEYFQNQSKRFDVRVLPTFILFKNGNEFGRIENEFTEQAFKNTFGDICIETQQMEIKYDER